MSISVNAIDSFVEQQINLGTSVSIVDAEQEIAARLFEKELDAKIQRGRADVEAGRVRAASPENNALFLSSLTKKLLCK